MEEKHIFKDPTSSSYVRGICSANDGKGMHPMTWEATSQPVAWEVGH